MKRVIALLLILMCVIGAAGCQKTPESPIVVGKDYEKMIEQAVSGEKTDDSPVQQAGEKTDASAAPKIEAIERYSIEEPLKSASGDLEVYIDAEVNVPSGSALTTARVSRYAFTEEECARYVSALFQGQKTYSGEVRVSKADMQNQILELKKQLAMETDSESKERLQGSIEKYEMVLHTMPEGEGFVETPAVFSNLDTRDVETMFLVSDGSDGLYRSMQIRNDYELHSYGLLYESTKGSYPYIVDMWSTTTTAGIKHGTAEYGDPDALPDPHKSEAEAIAEADAMLAEMGITDFSCRDADVIFGNINGKVQKAYQLSYTRNIGGAAFNYNSSNSSSYGSGAQVVDGKGGYISVWEDEKMTFFIADYGIARFEYVNPYGVTDVVTENTAMKDFESIMDIFKKMIMIVYADVQEEMKKIEIDRIELGLMRVLEPNSLDTGVIIPVWDFYGKEHKEVDGETWTWLDPNRPYLTINAIDGSVIDRTAGY